MLDGFERSRLKGINRIKKKEQDDMQMQEKKKGSKGGFHDVYA